MAEQVRPEVLISRLTSNNETWRVEAETRLVALGEPAVEPLIGALQHASPAVRMHAVHALGKIRDPRAIAPMVKALGDTENNGATAIAAEKALVEWGEPVKRSLLEAVRQSGESARPRALRALGKIGGADLEAELRAFLGDSIPAIRAQAATALAAAIDKRAIEAITPLLKDPDKWVRYGVAEALLKIGSTLCQTVLE